MNIKELKEYIKELPDDLLVVCSWYEWGYDTLEIPEEIKLVHKPNNNWYYWRYEESEYEWDIKINAVKF